MLDDVEVNVDILAPACNSFRPCPLYPWTD